MSFAAAVLTLYPAMFPGPLGHALAGRALADGRWSLEAVNIRDFATDRHRTVDDTPAGGGPGMVMRADVLARAIDATPASGPRLLMSPRGRPFDQAMAEDLAAGPGVTLVCGRFEGVDERVIDARDLTEVSIGDFVLSGGGDRSACRARRGGAASARRHGQQPVGEPRKAFPTACWSTRNTRARPSSRAAPSRTSSPAATMAVSPTGGAPSARR